MSSGPSHKPNLHSAIPALCAILSILIASFSFLVLNRETREIELETISLPEGFEISVYARDVDHARSLCLTPNGTLFVGSRNHDRVYAVLDHDGDNIADEVITIARNLNTPNGVAFRNGSLYVAEIHRILRYDEIESRLHNPPDPVVVKDDFPTDASHGWKFIRFGPDGKLYIPVGAPCNICESEDDIYGTITRMDPDGSNFELFASGIRNSVGFDWHPESGDLWFTENGRDRMGNDIPPDELNHAPTEGLHFGYPYCHGQDIPDPEFGEGKDCQNYTPPAMDLGPHVAALGMRFYQGEQFPDRYSGQIFIAEHGSWNRDEKIGYRVMLVELENSTAVSYSVFAEGWLQGDEYWGRPVDVEVMHDGSLLVSDDYAGAIYRIAYTGTDN
jgi:glucose/arabinose dehydrogenase